MRQNRKSKRLLEEFCYYQVWGIDFFRWVRVKRGFEPSKNEEGSRKGHFEK